MYIPFFCGKLDIHNIMYEVQLKFLTKTCNINCLSVIPCCFKLFVSSNAFINLCNKLNFDV